MKKKIYKILALSIAIQVLFAATVSLVPAITDNSIFGNQSANVAFTADNPAPPTTDPASPTPDTPKLDGLKNLTFPVQKFLKLPGDQQTQSYFGGETRKQTKYPAITFVLGIIDTLTKVAGTIAVLMLIITGFVMIFSQGNQNTLEKAKQMLFQEILGILVIFASYMIVTLISSVFTK